jgi:hypothetical protein
MVRVLWQNLHGDDPPREPNEVATSTIRHVLRRLGLDDDDLV